MRRSISYRFRQWLLRPVLDAQCQTEETLMAKIEDIIADEQQLKTAVAGLVTAGQNAQAQIQQLKAEVGDNAALQGQLDDLHSSLQADIATAVSGLPTPPDTTQPVEDSPVADTSQDPLPDTGSLTPAAPAA